MLASLEESALIRISNPNCSLCITTFSIEQKSTKIDSDDHMFRNICSVFARSQKTRAISRFVYAYKTRQFSIYKMKDKDDILPRFRKMLKLHYTFKDLRLSKT